MSLCIASLTIIVENGAVVARIDSTGSARDRAMVQVWPEPRSVLHMRRQILEGFRERMIYLIQSQSVPKDLNGPVRIDERQRLAHDKPDARDGVPILSVSMSSAARYCIAYQAPTNSIVTFWQ